MDNFLMGYRVVYKMLCGMEMIIGFNDCSLNSIICQ